ncbi:ABC transporter ATP-binding protein [Clostridium kluyveri]|uniref:ABC transporter ATP-binding protein n=1 Tax=Clostridium kluyveri TaxID=1534 RepID=UPI0022465F94|nr:ABC transporter ATP-binding protein [Clostridium kluyveri]UZQ52706.1 ABC transporter ATP-binding protein [Clostridium kluyveri]
MLKLENVSKSIGKREIVKNLNLTVNEGEIFGFLGPNGSGKTTTIKMIVGFLKPTRGEIYVYGKSIKNNRISFINSIAAVVEAPDMYLYLTGIENLKQLARLDRNITQSDIDEAVKLVGLGARIGDKFKKYSLGMKQRLGIAQVLMGNKKVWILDEPTNGLDPSGMIHFRNIFKKYSKENKVTIFISSHILGEMESMCDRVAFLNEGEIKGVEDITNMKGSLEKRYMEVVGGEKDDFCNS